MGKNKFFYVDENNEVQEKDIISDFEYNYGDIAFYGGVLLIIVIGLIILYITNPPM